jgi:hypothetical protein
MHAAGLLVRQAQARCCICAIWPSFRGSRQRHLSGRRGTLNKYALLSELSDYAQRGQSLVAYHHADRSDDARTQAAPRLSELAEAARQAPVGAIIARRTGSRVRLAQMSRLSYTQAEAFMATIPQERWSSFKDVASAEENPDAAMAIGNWLRESGGRLPN